MLVATSACGRLGYDPLARDGDGAIIDAPINDASTLDGLVGIDAPLTPGDGPTGAGPEYRVSDAAGQSLRPSMVWTGTDLAIVWDDARDGGRDIYLSRWSLDGNEDLDDTALTVPTTDEAYPAAAWTGTLAVAWEDSRNGDTEIYAAEFADDGGRIGSEHRVTNTVTASYDPMLVWNGSKLGLAFDDGGKNASEAMFALLDADTTTVNGPIERSSNPARSARVSVAWNSEDAEFGMAWEDTRIGTSDIFYSRVDDLGNPFGAESFAVSTSAFERSAALLYGADRYGMAWEEERNGTAAVKFVLLDRVGNRLSSVVTVSTGGDARAPSLAWNGVFFAIAWSENDQIQFVLLDPGDASLVGTPFPLSTTPGVAAEPTLVWTGSSFAVAWDDTRNGGTEIYLRVLSP